jgi:hypothetical protein
MLFTELHDFLPKRVQQPNLKPAPLRPDDALSNAHDALCAVLVAADVDHAPDSPLRPPSDVQGDDCPETRDGFLSELDLDRYRWAVGEKADEIRTVPRAVEALAIRPRDPSRPEWVIQQFAFSDEVPLA